MYGRLLHVTRVTQTEGRVIRFWDEDPAGVVFSTAGAKIGEKKITVGVVDSPTDLVFTNDTQPLNYAVGRLSRTSRWTYPVRTDG